nr:hypothetical protein [Tanacetum cinerariifolium]
MDFDGTPTEPHHTPSLEAQQTSPTTHSSPTLPPVSTANIPLVIPTAPLPTVTPSNTPYLRKYTRRARIAQSLALSPVADEPAYPLRDASQGEACPTGLEIESLKARIKVLEDKDRGVAEQSGDDAPIKGRRLDVGEEAAERVSDDTEEMVTVLTSMDASTVLASGVAEVPTGSGSIPTAVPLLLKFPLFEGEHLSTIPETESNEVIKSSVEILVPIPSESKGIYDDTCDVPFCDNSPPLDVLNDHFEIFSDFNDDCTSSDDDSFEDIDYVEASAPDSELVSLEEVIEFRDSYKAPTSVVTTGTTSDGTGKKKRRTVTLTADDMQKRKNDAVILKTFGGNEATKKTKKNLLKQQYGNFKAEGLETLEQTFNRLQRNRSDLDTMSLDDLYNHLKVYESEMQKNSELNSQNMAFISSAKHSSGNEEVNTASVSTANTNVSTASANIRAPKALMAIDGVGWDWSYISNDEENHALIADEETSTEFALMAKTSAESEVFDNSLCSKASLAKVESRLAEHRNQELKYCEKIRVLEFKTESSADCIKSLKKELELLKKEKEGLETKLTGFQTALKDLDSLLESQRLDKNKEGLGCSVVPPPPAQIYSPSKKDISWTGLLECADDTITYYRNPTKSKIDKAEIAKKPSSQNNIDDKGQNFKLSDDDNMLLRIPRQHNMYSIDLNNIVPHKDLTCLVAKASADEGMLWHRRLGHLNFNTINSGNSNPTATSTDPPADQLERLTVETPIPTISSPVPTACLNDSPEPTSDTRLILKRVANQVETPSLDNILTLTNQFKDILRVITNSVDSNGVEADMDMKSAFLYGTIDEEVYVMQLLGFQDPEFPVKVYKVEKSIEFEALMHEIFQMSDMDELNFFLGLQVLQKEDGIFLSQDKYVGDILKKFGYSDVRSSNTPMDKENP